MAPSGQAGRDLLIDNNALYNMTHTGGKSEQAPGTYVCVSGAESYDSNGGHIVCGYVVSDEVSIPYQDGSGFVLTDATTASVRTLNGDSGAPMNGGSAMLGLLSSYSPGLQQGAYTKVYNVELRTGVRYQY